MKITPRSEEKLKVVGILQNRSDLSKEMLELCEKLPIYRVTKGEVAKQLDQTNDAVQQDSDLLAQLPAKRKTVKHVHVHSWYNLRVLFIDSPISKRLCKWVYITEKSHLVDLYFNKPLLIIIIIIIINNYKYINFTCNTTSGCLYSIIVLCNSALTGEFPKLVRLP